MAPRVPYCGPQVQTPSLDGSRDNSQYLKLSVRRSVEVAGANPVDFLLWSGVV